LNTLVLDFSIDLILFVFDTFNARIWHSFSHQEDLDAFTADCGSGHAAVLTPYQEGNVMVKFAKAIGVPSENI
jgi:hypothetical protein